MNDGPPDDIKMFMLPLAIDLHDHFIAYHGFYHNCDFLPMALYKSTTGQNVHPLWVQAHIYEVMFGT